MNQPEAEVEDVAGLMKDLGMVAIKIDHAMTPDQIQALLENAIGEATISIKEHAPVSDPNQEAMRQGILGKIQMMEDKIDKLLDMRKQAIKMVELIEEDPQDMDAKIQHRLRLVMMLGEVIEGSTGYKQG